MYNTKLGDLNKGIISDVSVFAYISTNPSFLFYIILKF